MACRVGMSANPTERINYWKQQEGHIAGQILASGLTYEEAQKREEVEARNRDCVHRAGGQYLPGRVWSVYYVWGGTVSNY